MDILEEKMDDGGKSKRALESPKEQGSNKDAKKRRCSAITKEEHLLTQALTPLVESGVLTTKELGRLLLKTCKRMTAAVDDPWKSLCFDKWGVSDSTQLFETLGMSPKVCFRKLVVDSKKKFEGPRPLRYSPEDYVVIISMSERVTGKPSKHMFCKAIPGQNIPQFFEDGKASIEFKQPLWSAALDTWEPADPDSEDNALYIKREGSFQILRRSDQRILVINFYSCEEALHIYLEDGQRKMKVESSPFSSTFGSKVTGRYGSAFYQKYFFFYDYYGVDLVPDYRLCESSDEIVIHGFEFSFTFGTGEDEDDTPFSDIERATRGNITVAHFLEAMMDD